MERKLCKHLETLVKAGVEVEARLCQSCDGALCDECYEADQQRHEENSNKLLGEGFGRG